MRWRPSIRFGKVQIFFFPRLEVLCLWQSNWFHGFPCDPDYCADYNHSKMRYVHLVGPHHNMIWPRIKNPAWSFFSIHFY